MDYTMNKPALIIPPLAGGRLGGELSWRPFYHISPHLNPLLKGEEIPGAGKLQWFFHLAFLLFILPLPASALTSLTVCDGKSYDVTVTNGQQQRVAHITPTSGPIEEYGPTVTFQLPGRPPVTASGTYDEYCIWNGKITIQTRDIGAEGHGGGGR